MNKSPIPQLLNYFIGRKEILNDIVTAIQAKKSAVVLKAPIGTGKTTLLQRVIHNSREKGFTSVIIEGKIYPEVLLKRINAKAISKGFSPPSTPPILLKERIQQLTEQYLQKGKMIIAFDDFEANLDSQGKFANERLKELLMYWREALTDKDTFLFFTTDRDIPGFEAIAIPPFSEEESSEFIKRLPALGRMDRKSTTMVMFDIGTNPGPLILLDRIAAYEFAEKKFDWETFKKKIPTLAERIFYKNNPGADFSLLFLDKLLSYLPLSAQQWMKALAVYQRQVTAEAVAALGVKITSEERKLACDLALVQYHADTGLFYLHSRTARFLIGKCDQSQRQKLQRCAAAYIETPLALTAPDENNIISYTEEQIAARAFYLAIEEWDKAANISLQIDQNLLAHNYPQLAYDLLEDIRSIPCSQDIQITIKKRLMFYYSLFALYEEILSHAGSLAKILQEKNDLPGAAACYQQLAAVCEMKVKNDEALKAYNQALVIFEKLQNFLSAAAQLLNIGKLQQRLGQFDEAARHYASASAYSEKVNDLKGFALATQHAAILAEDRNQLDLAFDLFPKALAAFQKLDDLKEITSTLHHIGNIFFFKGQFDSSLDYYQQAYQQAEKNQDKKGSAYSLGQIGMIHHAAGELDQAYHYYNRAREILEQLEETKGLSSALHQLGRIAQDRGQLATAFDYYQQSLALREKNADLAGAAIGYGQLGLLYLQKEEYEESLRASCKAYVIFSRMNAPAAQSAGKNMLKAREKLTPDQFKQILEEFNIQFTTQPQTTT